MKTAVLLFSVCTTSLGAMNRRLLQSELQMSPEGNYLGAWGQECGNILGNFECTTTTQVLTDQGNGKVECPAEWSCCICNTVYCGYDVAGDTCDGIYAGAPYALYGVQQVALQGEYQGSGATLDCGGLRSCAKTYIEGQWLAPIKCSGPYSCEEAVMEFEASNGISCAGTACIDTKITLPTNQGGDIKCSGSNACKRANFEVHGGVENVLCHGRRACRDANITVYNPVGKFHLSCQGDQGCEGLTLNVVVENLVGNCAVAPVDFIDWAGISCGGNGACVDLKFTVANEGCQPILLEDLKCQANQACTNAVFDFHAHTSYPVQNEVFIQNCLCGPSCQHATGLDKCYQNLRVIQCTNPYACGGVQEVWNVANDFMLLCTAEHSCSGYGLNIAVTDASKNIIQRFAGFEFTAANAGENAVVHITNTQVDAAGNAIDLVVEYVVCSAPHSCDGLVFIAESNVIIQDFICASADACENCRIKTDPHDVGVPCYEAPSTTTTTAAPVVSTLPAIPTIPGVSVSPVEQTTSAAPVSSAAPDTTAAPGTSAAPGTDAPVTTAPVTTAAAAAPGTSSAPGTTSAPVTTASGTPAPVTPVTVHPELITPAPVAPVTLHPELITPAPVAPVTPAPLLEPVIPIEPIPQAETSAAPVVDNPQTGGSPAPPQPEILPPGV